MFLKSSTPIILASFLLSIFLKNAYIVGTPIFFLLFFYFINTTLLLFNIYHRKIFMEFYIINKIILLFISFLLFSSNKIFFDISYGIYCIFIVLSTICLYFCYYTFCIYKHIKKSIQINFSSYIFDYLIIFFIIFFGINSNIIFIPLFSALFDIVCIIFIIEGSLQLNKGFNKKQIYKI